MGTLTTDLAPFAGTIGGGFFIGFLTGYAMKKVVKLAAIIVGLYRRVRILGIS
jgi:uncharacterized membrane protein (Fun14 family)